MVISLELKPINTGKKRILPYSYMKPNIFSLLSNNF